MQIFENIFLRRLLDYSRAALGLSLCAAALCLQGCVAEDPYGKPVALPIERARLHEQRIAKDGALGPSFDLASFSGSRERPCLELTVAEGSRASEGYSVVLLSAATSEALLNSNGGYSMLFDTWNFDWSLVARRGGSTFLAAAGKQAALVAPIGEPRCLVVGYADSVSYSIAESGLLELARRDTSLLSGDLRGSIDAVALQGGGYAALAWDRFLQAEVCSFLGDDLAVLSASRLELSSRPRAIGSSAAGTLSILESDSSSYKLFSASRTARSTSTAGSLPSTYLMGSIAWAGDRFWLCDGGYFASLQVDGGGIGFQPSPYPNYYLTDYRFRGLPDGGLLVFGPTEPSRSSGTGYSPPYLRETIHVSRYDKDFKLSWSVEWTPQLPSRILDAAGDGDGVSVFLCARSEP
jgi:hypothetical protein